MKNSDLRSVLSSLIDLAESGDVRGTSFGSRAAGPLLGLLAHNVAKAKSAPANVENVESAEAASVEIVTAPAEAASVETVASARKSRVASASV